MSDEVSEITDFQRIINMQGFGDSFLNRSATVNWDSFRKTQTDSVAVFEFEIKTTEKKVLSNELYADTMYYSLVTFIDKNRSLNLIVLEWIPLVESKFEKPEYVNRKLFSGLLNSYASDGELINAEFLTFGKKKSELSFDEMIFLREHSKEDKVLLKAPPVGGCDCWVAVWVENYTDWYQTAIQGTSSITTYLGREYSGRTLIYVYMPSDGSGGSGIYEQTETRTAVHGPRYSVDYSSKALFYDEQVLLDKSFATNEWLKCIYDRLVEVDAFRQALLRFTGEYPVIHLRFDVGDVPKNAEGIDPVAATYPPINFVSRIRVNTKFSSNYSTLLMAKTLIHEVLHAEMYRKLMELASNNGSIDKQKVEKYLSENNYPGLFDYYERYGYKTMQHELMAAHYVNIMTDILAEFDNYSLTFNYYEAFVWQGSLTETSSYQNLSSGKRDSMIVIFNKEKLYGVKSCIN